MEPQDLLPHLQVPATSPCSEPAHPLKIHLNIILPFRPGYNVSYVIYIIVKYLKKIVSLHAMIPYGGREV
jgi:hypothetical protein